MPTELVGCGSLFWGSKAGRLRRWRWRWGCRGASANAGWPDTTSLVSRAWKIDGVRNRVAPLGRAKERVASADRSGPTDQDDLVCSLRGKDFQRILAEEFQLLRSLPAVYWLLHRLGYSYLRPRPRHRKANPEALAAFQRSGPTAWRRSRPSIREAAADLLPGRIAVRAAGDDHQCLGPHRFTAHGHSSDRIRIPVGAGSRLPRDGACRRIAEPPTQHEDRQHLSAALLPDDSRANTR